MQNKVVAAKIEELRAAHRNGEFKSHDIVKAMKADDSTVASSWGPAMRR